MALPIGYKLTNTWKKSISIGSKGRIPWNKGLRKDTDIRVQRYSQSVSETLKGKEPWNKDLKGVQFHTEQSRLKISLKLRRENHPNWKGGITSLGVMIRNLPEGRQWRRQILKRDNYTCQHCGKRHCDFEIHHIKLFSVILSEFLQIYSQFSIVEDKETLVRLSLSYPEFWDKKNGETLCIKCHEKEEKYVTGKE